MHLRGREWIIRHASAIGFCACILIAGFFVTYKLSESPRTWFDEGLFIQFARNLLMHGSFTLRASPTEMLSVGSLATVGFPVVAPIAFSMKLFGIGLMQARVIMVAYVLFCVSAAYWFAYRAWGSRIAFWATMLIATHAPLYGNGKNVLGEVPGLFFTFITLGLLDRLERKGRASRWMWAGMGLAAGLFMATKPNFLLLLPALVIGSVVCRKRMTFGWQEGLCASVAMLFPVGINAFLQFGSLSAIVSGFGGYANLPGLEQFTGLTMLELIQKNVLLFVQQPTPIYLLLVCLVWMMGMGFRLKRKNIIPLHEIVALLFVGATVAYFLKMPGFFRYLFIAQIITFPYFVMTLFTLIQKRVFVTIGLTVLIAMQVYQVFFSSWVAGHYTSTRTQELATFMQKLDLPTHVFFYHTPEAVTFYPHENYSQYFQLLYYGDAFGKNVRASLQNGVPNVVIVSSEVESEALPFLDAYERRLTLDGDHYLIFERKP